MSKQIRQARTVVQMGAVAVFAAVIWVYASFLWELGGPVAVVAGLLFAVAVMRR